MPQMFKRKVDWSKPTERDFGTKKKKVRERPDVRFFNNLMEYSRYFSEGRVDEKYLTDKFVPHLIKLIDGNIPGTTKHVGTTSEPLTGRYSFNLKVDKTPVEIEITRNEVVVITKDGREHVNNIDELVAVAATAPYDVFRTSKARKDLIYGVYVETNQISERKPTVVYMEEASTLEDLLDIIKSDRLDIQAPRKSYSLLHEGYSIELGDYPKILVGGKVVSKEHTHTATVLFFKWTRSENPVDFTDEELRILKETAARLTAKSVSNKH